MADPVSVKRCTQCGLLKSIDAFSHTGSGYKRSNCRECAAKQMNAWYHHKGGADYFKRYRKQFPERLAGVSRRSRLKRAFGLTEDGYENLLRQQNGQCGLCERPQKDFKKRFSVDHDHRTNRVRMLLCGPCNTALGLLQDDPALLRLAADYVEKFRQAS